MWIGDRYRIGTALFEVTQPRVHERGSTRDIWWFHGARNRSEQAFAEEVIVIDL